MNAARLAAEAAFSPPDSNWNSGAKASGPAPRIVVRRARALDLPSDPGSEVQATENEAHHRSSRVFRLPTAASPEPAATVADVWSGLPPGSVDSAESIAPRRRAGRRPDRIGGKPKSGPVVMIVSPPAAAPAGTDEPRVPGRHEAYTDSSRVLGSLPGFFIVDDGLAAKWERLARQARLIGRDIDAALLKTV